MLLNCRYECTAVNEHGQASAQSLVVVKAANTNDVIIMRAFKEASEDIDRAVKKTLKQMFDGSLNQSVNPFRLSRFPDAIGRANARPAEILERTLQIIRRMVREGEGSNLTEEFQYQEILTAEQVMLLYVQ